LWFALVSESFLESFIQLNVDDSTAFHGTNANWVNDAITTSIERLRNQLPCGLTQLGLPSLDPFFWSSYSIQMGNLGDFQK